jgi:hypothetical protein
LIAITFDESSIATEVSARSIGAASPNGRVSRDSRRSGQSCGGPRKLCGAARFAPPDFAALDIGEDGRLASIDPAVCDFNDATVVKVVELDDAGRWRQVNYGEFATIEEFRNQTEIVETKQPF